jgi:enamine deaminase RidA (YjgF/YER057c/UK114 family)
MSETIHPAGWAPARGYANGMLAPHGRLLAVAGQIAWDAQQQVVSDDFPAQFEQALANVVQVVTSAGGLADQIISLTIYVTDKQAYLYHLREVGAGYRRVMGKHYPAMALVEVKGLLEPRAKVEIQALAVIPEAD